MTTPRRMESSPRNNALHDFKDPDITREYPSASSSSADGLRADRAALPREVLRVHQPRADAIWIGLTRARAVVASGDSHRSPQPLDDALGGHDLAIGRPNDKLWGTRIDPSAVRAPLFAAIASDTAGRRTVVGRRLSTLARRYLGGGAGRVFIGVEGEICAPIACALADELLARMAALPDVPVVVIVRALSATSGFALAPLVVIGNASSTYASVLGSEVCDREKLAVASPTVGPWSAPLTPTRGERGGTSASAPPSSAPPRQTWRPGGGEPLGADGSNTLLTT